MSMPKISNISPEINITRQDATNIIITSIAMEELALAHILNAEGEKLQYVLGTLEGRDPGEVTVCDIMEISKSTHNTLRDILKTEMLLQLKLKEAIELSGSDSDCQLTIRGKKIWRDDDNVGDTRPDSLTITLLRDGESYKTATIDPLGDGEYVFDCLPLWKDSANKYDYQIDEITVPAGYIKVVSGYDIINTLESDIFDIDGVKIWIDNNNEFLDRPSEISVNLLQNGVIINTETVPSPPDEEDTATFRFTDLPRYDDEGNLYNYTLDEQEITNYIKSVNSYTITNTHINIP